MFKKIYVCDCCKKEFGEEEAVVKNITFQNERYILDLCKECAENLKKELKSINDNYDETRQKIDAAFDKAKRIHSEARESAEKTKREKMFQIKEKYNIGDNTKANKTADNWEEIFYKAMKNLF